MRARPSVSASKAGLFSGRRSTSVHILRLSGNHLAADSDGVCTRMRTHQRCLREQRLVTCSPGRASSPGGAVAPSLGSPRSPLPANARTRGVSFHQRWIHPRHPDTLGSCLGTSQGCRLRGSGIGRRERGIPRADAQVWRGRTWEFGMHASMTRKATMR